MRIKQVEELVGITSKNIRFYEDQGLLKPERADNGYREYHQKEVDILKKIKLLRKMNVSVEEIKTILEGQTSLQECLEQHIDRLESERENLGNMQQLADALVRSECTIESVDTDEWLDQMEKMEQEGIDFVNLSKVDVHMKKKMGATVGGTVMIALLAFLIGMILWGNSVDPIPIGFLIFFIVSLVGIMIGIIVALRSRLREIEGGEEDEAAKY